ncbi:hypothetical protein PT2222_30303 [Paraburkholderia tropica]
MKRQIVLMCERFEIAVIRRDAGNIHRQFAHAPAKQQIGEAMFEPRNHDEHFRTHLKIVDGPRHRVLARGGREFVAQACEIAACRRVAHDFVKDAAQKKAFADVVVENGELVDIAVVPVQKARDGGHLASGARTGQREDVLMRTNVGGHADSPVIVVRLSHRTRKAMSRVSHCLVHHR